MRPVLDGLRALGPARLAAMAVVAVGMLGILALLAMRGGAPSSYALLYADLDLREAGQLVDALDKAHIAHQEQGGGQTVLVPSSDVARARLLLAKDGLPSGGSIGYEIFDRGDSLTASQFQQEMNQTRAMEGEIARSVRMIAGVRAARVHLVMPKRQPFSHQQQEAQASVVLTMAGGARMDREGVQSVLNLISAAVPGLRARNIALIDSRGNLLARAGDQSATDGAEAAQTAEKLRHATEQRLSRSVEDLLERSLGPGRVRAEAAVQMDFDQLHETQESYNPDQQVVRSTQTNSDNSKSTEAADKPTTVANNLPNADAGATQSQAGSQQQKQEETTNYEIGKTVRTTVHDQPQIHRISLAVMVDGTVTPDADGKPAWHERTPEELARIATIARSAIGFDEKRGDKVEVVSMRFVAPDADTAAPEPASRFGLHLERSDIMTLVQTGAIGLIALLALFFVVRPTMLRLTTPTPGLEPPAGALLGSESTPQASLALAGPRGPAVPALAGPAAEPGEAMVNLANVEGQMRASTIRKIGELVDKHPEESLMIVRGWISQEKS
jgi:flagellar M-ring protein FliF